MKQYESISGIKVYADNPTNIDIGFLNEAEKAGFYLFEVRKFNKNNDSFEHYCRFFAKEYDPNIMIDDDHILVLAEDDPLSYGVVTSEALIDWFKPIGNTQEPEMSYNKLVGKLFYLDAGHGGKDSGAVNDNFGLHEKIAALDVCLYLGEILEKQRAEIYYSRVDDSYPSLTTRANEANNMDVDAFISIHLNSANNKSASGIETLVYGLKGIAYELASKVQSNMVEVTGWANRGVKARPELTVLKKTKMPAILCEIGFISNDVQAKELFKKETQKKIASAIAQGIIDQFG